MGMDMDMDMGMGMDVPNIIAHGYGMARTRTHFLRLINSPKSFECFMCNWTLEIKAIGVSDKADQYLQLKQKDPREDKIP